MSLKKNEWWAAPCELKLPPAHLYGPSLEKTMYRAETNCGCSNEDICKPVKVRVTLVEPSK